MICVGNGNGNHSFPESDIGAVQLENRTWLCSKHTDEVLTLKPANDGGYVCKPSRKADYCWGAIIRTKKVEREA